MKVLNGEVSIGDRVAVAVGDGQYGGGMRIGTVVAFGEENRWGATYPTLKVSVDQASGTIWGKVPYAKTFSYPQRVVKLAASSE
jgi:hypothetical protein